MFKKDSNISIKLLFSKLKSNKPMWKYINYLNYLNSIAQKVKQVNMVKLILISFPTD